MHTNTGCPCRHTDCERFGKCSECMSHHAQVRKTPTACDRIRLKEERRKRHSEALGRKFTVKHRIYFESPIGMLCAEDDGEALISLYISENKNDSTEDGVILENVRTEISEYFEGKRTDFDIPLHLHGTEFQLDVWDALIKIPFGSTVTYSDIARMCSDPAACRAVGGAVNKNPVMIIVPCHRIIGKNGALTGFAAGVDIKKKLLQLENDNIHFNNK